MFRLFAIERDLGTYSGVEVRGESEETLALCFVSALPFDFDFDLDGGSKTSSSSSVDSSITWSDETEMFDLRPTAWIVLATLDFVFRERILARSAMLAMLEGISIWNSEEFKTAAARTRGERMLEELEMVSGLSFFL